MMLSDPQVREAFLDLLFDLQHDLGKYLRLPLRFLPREANDAEVRAALETALRRTRQGPGGARAAGAIWSDFRREAEGLGVLPRLAEVEEAVDGALACEHWLASAEPIDREAVDAALAAVGAAIRELIEEVERAG